MLNDRGARDYMNLEEDLETLVKPYLSLQLEYREQALEVIRREMAKRVCNVAKVDLLKTRDMVTELKSGKASLGNISRRDEIREMHDLVQRFEFNCLQLADFRKKYGVE